MRLRAAPAQLSSSSSRRSRMSSGAARRSNAAPSWQAGATALPSGRRRRFLLSGSLGGGCTFAHAADGLVGRRERRGRAAGIVPQSALSLPGTLPKERTLPPISPALPVAPVWVTVTGPKGCACSSMT
jgi:hypothetical protein